MLDLLDTGRMAHKFGKWRGVLYLVAAAVPVAIGSFIARVFDVLPGQPEPPEPLQWLEMGLFAIALMIWIYGWYQLYRDHMHHDYYLEADRCQREGW